MGRRRATPVGFALALLAAASGCADPADQANTVGPATICVPQGTAQADTDLPAVGSVEVAIAALEALLGGAQDYFEINTTARVVNLFVALNGATLAQAWVFVDGGLSSQEPQSAAGGTFTASDLDFDPGVVLGAIRAEVPDSILETFYVNGDGNGSVRYGVLTSALCGGGLDVTVAPDGTVLSVTPL